MAKRTAEEVNENKIASAKTDPNAAPEATRVVDDPAENGEDIDMEGELVSEEEEILEIDSEGEDDDDQKLDERGASEKAQRVIEKDRKRTEEAEQEGGLYLPHRSKPLGPDEVLEADPSVYEMLHNVNMPWPCLTVDILPDDMGSERRRYPASMYLATGTQAERNKDNELMVLKLSGLSKTLVKDDAQDEDDDDDEDNEGNTSDPILENENIPLKSTTNRLRVSPHAAKTGEYLTASMLENGEVQLFDVASQYRAFTTPGFVIPKQSRAPIYTIKNHVKVEGYGLDWSPLISTGALLSGDVNGNVYFTSRTTSSWTTEGTPFVASDASIEDIQWSTSEKTVFATAGTDGYVRIWDTRSKKHKPAISVKASDTDVNVISWCSKVDYLLASGHDDGNWGIWDLRSFGSSPAPAPVVNYDFHKSAITSISFNPLDESIVAVSSEDNTVTLWDLAVEADDEEIKQQQQETKELNDIPPQLLFVHWQRDVKDVRWHSQIPGTLVSTGSDGLNVWKTISV
ncbi:hypothetical protein LJB42_003249 [Komagataella kurtzmanii]|nr:hypothetical protein LJB42_003249 [Komagataella kurtzmanii]